MRTHKVFLGLKSDLAKVNKIWNSFICLHILTFSSSFPFYLFFFTVFPTQAVQAAYKADELVDYSHWQYKSEEGRRIATVEAFNVAEKSLKDLKVQLSQSENDRKSSVTTLEGAERQAKTQRKQLRQAEFDLVSTREQNKGLMKKLKEAKKAKDQAE